MPDSHQLRFALLFVIASSGCVDTPVDPADRYRGPTHPCDVVYDGSHEPFDGTGLAEDREDPFAGDGPPKFWLPGPYPAWNTSPHSDCRADPTIPTIGVETIENEDGTTTEVSHDDVRMYITYPAMSAPTVSGDGRVAEGRFPVVLFAHANNDRTCNIYRGYYSLHDHWASWGFIVVAIDGTNLNCKRGTRQNVELRSMGQLAAIDALRALDEDPESLFFERIDTDRVVFAGHSRGGGASLLSQQAHPGSLGVIDLQGVDVTAFGFGAAKLGDFPVLGMTAGEDVDLNYPHVEPTEDQLGGPYTWVNINGGIHAHTADSAPIEPDDVPLIGRKQQHDVTELFSTAFLARVAGVPAAYGEPHSVQPGADDVLFSHEGARVVDAEIARLGVFTRWRSDAPALWVDDFDSPIQGNSENENLLGGSAVSEGLTRSEEVATYKPDDSPLGGAYGKAYSRLLVGPGTFTTELGPAESRVRVPEGSTLAFRMKGPDDGAAAALRVELVGSGAPVDVGPFMGPEPISNRMLQVEIPAAELGGVDGAQAVRFHVGSGQIFIDDLRFVESR